MPWTSDRLVKSTNRQYQWTSGFTGSSDLAISATCKCCSALAKLMIPMYLLCLRVQIGVENGCYWTEYDWNTEHLVFGRETHNMRLAHVLRLATAHLVVLSL